VDKNFTNDCNVFGPTHDFENPLLDLLRTKADLNVDTEIPLERNLLVIKKG